jgi:hypothetical protein
MTDNTDNSERDLIEHIAVKVTFRMWQVAAGYTDILVIMDHLEAYWTEELSPSFIETNVYDVFDEAETEMIIRLVMFKLSRFYN